MAKVSILLVDDHEIVLTGLSAIIEPEEDLMVVGAVTTLPDALGQARLHQPQLILLDLRLGNLDGALVCRQLLEASPKSQVLILTAFLDEAALHRCLRAGARGYVLKDVNAGHLLDQVRAVVRGELVLDSKVAGLVVDRLLSLTEEPGRPRFGTQELAILKLVSQGLTNQQISKKMNLSPNTIKTHLKNLMAKTGTHNRTELAALALRRDLA